jgi:hypothetical protein
MVNGGIFSRIFWICGFLVEILDYWGIGVLGFIYFGNILSFCQFECSLSIYSFREIVNEDDWFPF